MSRHPGLTEETPATYMALITEPTLTIVRREPACPGADDRSDDCAGDSAGASTAAVQISNPNVVAAISALLEQACQNAGQQLQGLRGTRGAPEPRCVPDVCPAGSVAGGPAMPSAPARQAGRREAGQLRPVDQLILQMLADGATDDMVARRLGCSVRTVRRAIADLTGELNASSRFQAGLNAGRAGWL